MTIYLVQAFWIVFLGLLIHPNRSDRRKKEYLILVFLLLAIVSSIRAYSVGADTRNYVGMFNNVQYIGILNTRIEMGFMTYLKFLHIFSDNPRIMLFTSSFICVGVACLFTFFYSKDSIMSMLLYLLMGAYFSQMNVMRQALAVALTEVSFMLMLSNKRDLKRKLVAALLIFLASSVHTIALVAFVPYVLLLRGNNTLEDINLTVGKALLLSFALAIIGFVGYSLIMRIASLVFPQYAYYFNSTWSDANYNASLFAVLISVVFALAGACIFKNKELNGTRRFAVIMIGFSIIFNVLSMRMEIWSRLTGVFSIYTYLLWVPEFTSEIDSIRNRRILNSCIAMFALAYMLVILIFRPEWTLVVPYMVGK